MQLKIDESFTEKEIPADDSVRLLDKIADGMGLSAVMRAGVWRRLQGRNCALLLHQAAETMHVYSREEYAATPQIATSIGKCSPFTHIKLLDENGKEVAANEVGECYGKAYGMLSGYIGRPSPFVDGWFPTGDYLSKDEKGYYYFKDRKNFVIKSGGELVIPSEVENALLLNPKVQKAAVFGMKDKYFGEKVVAAVVLNQGETMAEEELISFAREHLASYKKPKTVFFMDDLMYTTVGKVDKRALIERCTELEQNCR